MNPKLKRLIIIANIAAYVVICAGIYVKKKGGVKAVMPRKKMTLQEMADMAAKTRSGDTAVVATPAAPVPVPAPAKPTPAELAKITTPPKPEVKPVPARRTPAVPLPPYIIETRKLLEEMKVKEKTLCYNYYAGMHRDPFVPLIGTAEYLKGVNFTPDELADLPYGLPEDEKSKASPFNLMATIKSKTGESAAIINDQILYKGDIIDEYVVSEIQRRKVTLRRGKRIIVLTIPFDESQDETVLLEKLKLQEFKILK